MNVERSVLNKTLNNGDDHVLVLNRAELVIAVAGIAAQHNNVLDHRL